jgi:hypothetical protein
MMNGIYREGAKTAKKTKILFCLHFLSSRPSRLRGGNSIFLFLAVMMLAAGCAPERYVLGESGRAAGPDEAIHNAERYLHDRPNWKIDCSHFVLACYHSPGMNAFLNRRHYNHNLVYDLNYYLTQQKTRRAHAADIQPGDILIFNKTYDINHDGHIDDKDVFTHTGLVESFEHMTVTYIDASEGRKPPRLHRRRFSFYGDGPNETVATDPATGHKIHARDTFYAAYGPPPE